MAFVREFNAMNPNDFHSDTTRKRVAELVAEIEKQTAAEVVVAVRPRSGFYRHADYLFGFALALADLALFLFYPRAMRVDTFPLEMLAMFALGAVVCAGLPPLRRLLVARSLFDQNVARAARAAFVDLGVSRTRARSGVLVYVSLFERRVAVVADVGVTDAEPGENWNRAKRALEASLLPSPDVERFFAALAALAAPLASALPITADDVNELPDAGSFE